MSNQPTTPATGRTRNLPCFCGSGVKAKRCEVAHRAIEASDRRMRRHLRESIDHHNEHARASRGYSAPGSRPGGRLGLLAAMLAAGARGMR